ncbi:brachyurin-like [Cloeon dipterum]|uniref:brachyurin-like n=1 Tax=Cloeon dipterum TaxID=197152 RepID=UPI00321FEB92
MYKTPAVKRTISKSVAASSTMRTSRWIVVLALLAQAFAAVTDRSDEDAEKLRNLHEASITTEYTLEELLTDSNYTEIEALLAMENEESTTNYEVDAATEKPSEEGEEDQFEFHNGTAQNGRILGGTPVTSETFPQYNYHVLIVSVTAADIERWFCGGALLSSTWALTAAHCVVLVSTITVYAGKFEDPSTVTSTPPTATAYIHPAFRLNLMINDIALLKLSTPLTLSGTIGTARLSLVKPTAALDNVALTTMGFGPKTDAQGIPVSGSSPVTLNVVEMTNVKKSTCNANTIDVYVTYPGNTGCLGTSSGTKGICFADEGAPVLYTSSSETTGKIIGVTSQRLACPSDYPGSFTWIYPYISWIRATTRKNFT